MSAAVVAAIESGRSRSTGRGVDASAGNGIPHATHRFGPAKGIHLDRPCRVRRDRPGVWVWSCWLCPAPACWIAHTAASWTEAVVEADAHAHAGHEAVPEAGTAWGWAA